MIIFLLFVLFVAIVVSGFKNKPTDIWDKR